MNRSEFNAVAKKNGLTVKQLVKLSMIQSEVYHAIKFNDAENIPSTTFHLGGIAEDGRKMIPLRKLEELGFINISCWRVQVTDKGWGISCNSGAGVYIGGCDDSDISDAPNEHAPVRNFNY